MRSHSVRLRPLLATLVECPSQGSCTAKRIARLGDRLVEREPRLSAMLHLVRGTEAVACPRHHPLVTLPFIQEHAEPESAFLILRDSPKARRCSVVALLQ